MNFSQMHERLRLELLRRIRRGTLSVSLLARQTGFGQSHMSNFLRGHRQLSLQALDRVLFSQHMGAWDLLPVHYSRPEAISDDGDAVPVISHAAALFEPVIRPSAVQRMLQLPPGLLNSARKRTSPRREKWHRFVALSIATGDAAAMDPMVLPEGLVVVDRHYTSLIAYRPGRNNIYAVRDGNRVSLRYVDFLVNRLVLRPHNLAFPVNLLEIPPGETLTDMIAGRIVLILNEV